MESFQTPLATCNMDRGILFLETKNVARTVKGIREHYAIIREHIKDKPVWLLEVKICDSYPKKVREIMSVEIPKLCSALAIVAKNPCEKMVANFFMLQEIRVKIFSDKEEAEKWLRDFM